MRIINLLQINDLDIKSFLKIILAIQLAVWGAIGLDVAGLQVPIIRQFIGFIYLAFVPGIIILRILKLHKLGNIETLLYSVGLSIATLMFTGLFMNTVYPFFGISGPISITSLIITISIVVLVLCILSYVRDNDFSNPSFIDIGDVLSPPVLFLCLIPFLSVFGTYFVNFYHTNMILMFLIVIIAIITLLIGFDKFIPKNLYPLAVFVIAIALLYHMSLISMYLWGWDNYLELYLSSLVTIAAQWDSTIPSIVNAMLSIVMFAPIFSNICNMSLTWILKIIYPLLFSLVPLGLYRVFQKQTDDKIAFLACFFFMSINTFYEEMHALARQEIAELFLVLLILLMVDKDMNKIKRSFLFIVFGISLAVSHYGLTYIYMFSLISAWLILILMDNPAMQRLRERFFFKFSRYESKKLVGNPISLKIENRTISSTFVLLFITFTLTWYMHISRSMPFNTIVHIGDHIASTIFTDFLNPEAADGLKKMTAQPHPGLLHEVHRVINYLNQIFIIIGGIVLLLKRREMKFESEYTAFSVLNIAILFACVSVPFFALSLNMTRMYQITLIFLAPFCVIGGITILRVISKVAKMDWTNKNVRRSLKVLSVYFVIFLLYQTGFVYEVSEGHSGSIALSQESIKIYGDAEDKIGLYSPYAPEQDVFGARWLSKNEDNASTVYTDENCYYKVVIGYGMFFCRVTRLSSTTNPEKGYIYLNYLNVVENILPTRDTICNTTEYHLIEKGNKIYSNGGSEVYWI